MRNWAFDKGILPSQSFEIPLISVGNLSTGGTGKTPMTEFLIENFSDKSIGLVSRGYGRQTQGLIKANLNHSHLEIGDEPFQMLQKFPQIKLALSEKRVRGIEALIDTEDVDLILLDDAFQHRYVKPDFQILLTTYSQPFYKDLVLPAGNLRESANGKKRANSIVITKCPDGLSKEEAEQIKLKVKPSASQSVYFSRLEYGFPQNHLKEVIDTKKREVIVLTGIANPNPMLEYLNGQFTIVEHLKYKDHHNFSNSDIEAIESLVNEKNLPIITTEKDWVRLKFSLNPDCLKMTYFLPLKVGILFGEKQKFLSEIENTFS